MKGREKVGVLGKIKGKWRSGYSKVEKGGEGEGAGRGFVDRDVVGAAMGGGWGGEKGSERYCSNGVGVF